MNRQFKNDTNRRLRNLIDRGVLNRSKYNGNVRLLQVSPRNGLTLDDIEHLEPYGYSSHAPDGGEPIILSLGGNRANAVVIMVNDRRHKVKLEKGESAIYTQHGEFIKLLKDNIIHAKAGTKILCEAPLAEFSQDVKINGNLDTVGNSTAADHLSDGISGKGHSHSDPQGGSVGNPT